MEQWRKDMNAALGAARAQEAAGNVEAARDAANRAAMFAENNRSASAAVAQYTSSIQSTPFQNPTPTPTPTPEVEETKTGGGESAVIAPTVTPPPAFSALEIIENTLRAALGVSGLGSWAVNLYNRGASPTEIIQSLRYGTDGSPEGQAARAKYLNAFPQIDMFIKDGTFAGENPELQYIAYRNTLKESAQRYGISDSLISNDKIVNYLTNKVSAAELTDRMSTAATAVATTPAETLAILNEYYGVQGGDLISFYLDPETTESELQKRYTAARIGTEAARNQFGINAQFAEDLAMRGISVDEAQAGFGRARSQSAFMYGRGETAGESNLINAQFGNEEAKKQIERIAKGRAGVFQGGGSFTASASGVGGLGSAATR